MAKQICQSPVSHDPSEILLIWWFASQETLFIDLCCLHVLSEISSWLRAHHIQSRLLSEITGLMDDNMGLLSPIYLFIIVPHNHQNNSK